MGIVTIQITNKGYTEERKRKQTIWNCMGNEKDGTRWFLKVFGEKIRPSFGVPYEEFWKIKDDPRIVRYERGPDSPFGEPVMHVVTRYPSEIGSGKHCLRKMVSHHYQGDVKYEKKVEIDLELVEGYLRFDTKDIDEYGYINANLVGTIGDNDERFNAPKYILYWDTEWISPQLTNERGDHRWMDHKNKEDHKHISIVTSVFLERVGWTFHSFTWHPLLKTAKEIAEEKASELSEDARKKIREMPEKYNVVVHAYTNESDMLNGMVEYLNNYRPDAIVGYNAFSGWHGKGSDKIYIVGFDLPWLYKRIKYLKINYRQISPIGKVYGRGGNKYNINTGMLTKIDMWHLVNFLDINKHNYDVNDEKLDTMERSYLGFGKIDHSEYPSFYEFWMNNPKKERNYCEGDVEGTAGVDLMFHISDDMYNRSSYCGANWEDGSSASRLHDQINLRLYKGDYYLDSKYQKWKREFINPMDWYSSEKVGGYVHDVKPGMSYYIAVVDFKGFYPSSGCAANCGPETFINLDHMSIRKDGLYLVEKKRKLVKEIDNWDKFLEDAPEDKQDFIDNSLLSWDYPEYKWEDVIWTPSAFYRKDIISKNVKAFDGLILKRSKIEIIAKKYFKEHKDYYHPDYVLWWTRQFSFKGLINGKFGVTGYPQDRTYMVPIFNTYTLVSRLMVMEGIRYLVQDLDYKLPGGDTDSVFLKLKQKPKWIEHDDGSVSCEEMDLLVEKVNRHLRAFAKENFNMDRVDYFLMECEDINDMFMQVTKKHYIKWTIWKDGMLFDKPKVFYKGVKIVSKGGSDVSKMVQKALAPLLRLESDSEAAEFCTQIHKEFKSYPPQFVAKRVPLNKPVDDYSTSSEQYKAFKLANDYFNAGFNIGDRAFVMRLQYCPPIINKRKVSPVLGDVIAFTEDMVPEILESGIVFDYDDMEEKQVACTADELLVRFDTTYWELIDKGNIVDVDDF